MINNATLSRIDNLCDATKGVNFLDGRQPNPEFPTKT